MSEDLSQMEDKAWMELSPQELSCRLMSLPGRKRLEAILSRADAAAVVAALPVQDFFFFVKEIGPDDALPLLALGEVNQLVHLFDLEWWEKDRIQPAKALQWLERLAAAGEEKLLAWLYDADFELLTVLFQKWLRVVVAPEDVDLLEAGEQLPKHTLDDQYFWETRYLQFEDFLARLLSLLFEVHPGFYRELMNHIIWVPEAGMEEDAYRFTRARLEDQAVPDFHDALRIYSRIGPRDFGLVKDVKAQGPAGAATPSFALALLAGDDLLNAALARVQDPPMIDTLRVELASLANKVILADRLALDEPQALRQAMAKVAAHVNLGLDLMSRGEPQEAVKIIQEVFLEHLFRLGHTQLLKLQGRLRKLLARGWLSRWPTGLNCLEPDWAEAAELLLQQTPRLLRPAGDHSDSAASREDFFRDRRDLAQGLRFLEIIGALGPLLDGLSVKPEEFTDRLWQEGQIRRLEDVTLGAMVWTAAVQFRLKGVRQVEPIPADQWVEGFGRFQPEDMEEAIRSWIVEIMPDAQQRELAEAYLHPLFEEYAQEMLPFAPDHPPDPRLVKFLMFQAPESEAFPATPVP